MTKHEFDTHFGRLCKALQVPVNATQVEMIWEEFQHDHVDDFALACRELAFGTPGYLPKKTFFRDNVTAAKDMRLEKLKAQRDAQAQRFWNSPKPCEDPQEARFQACCIALLKHRLGMDGPPLSLVRDALADPAFEPWLRTSRAHRDPDPRHDTCYDYLHDQLDTLSLPQPIDPVEFFG